MKTNFIRWTPRIISILAILFVSMFALDSFNPKFSIWQQILGFLIHLTPSYILTVFLIIAWKWEKFGGIIYLTIGIIFTLFLGIFNYHRTNDIYIGIQVALLIGFPFILSGILFIYSSFLHNKNNSINQQNNLSDSFEL